MVAGTLWLFTGLLSKPKYVTLYSGLRAEEAQAIGSRLAAKNIDYELSAWKQRSRAVRQDRCQPAGDGFAGSSTQRSVRV
jgi:flagellar biosynthesis/type III secretory pathway M-ring protein FliF/YscJ